MNRTHIRAVAAAFALSLTLAACGGGGVEETIQPSSAPDPVVSAAPSAEPSTTPSASYSAYVFLSGDFAVSIDQDMAEILAALGEPQSYFEAASCAFEGLDKTYTYSGFQVLTRPDGDKDYVNSILLTDDSVTTPEGLYIGASAADVTAAYGEEESLGSSLRYTKENVVLSFILENDVVVSIEYLPL